MLSMTSTQRDEPAEIAKAVRRQIAECGYLALFAAPREYAVSSHSAGGARLSPDHDHRNSNAYPTPSVRRFLDGRWRSLSTVMPCDDFLYELEAAFGRAGCRRLASLAVLAGQHHDHQTQERPTRGADDRIGSLLPRPANVNTGHRGGRGREARHSHRYAGPVASPAAANDSYGRGSILAFRDGAPAEDPVNVDSQSGARPHGTVGVLCSVP